MSFLSYEWKERMDVLIEACKSKVTEAGNTQTVSQDLSKESWYKNRENQKNMLEIIWLHKKESVLLTILS